MGELQGCVNDAKHMRSYLKNHHGFKDEEILMLIDEDLDPKALTILDKARFMKNRQLSSKKNRLPTTENILAGIAWLVDNVKSNSHLFLHYSGHGSYLTDHTGDEVDRKDETIIPMDYEQKGQIKDDYLRAVLVDVLPKNATLFCIFDCCHSGTMLDLRYRYKINQDEKRDDDYDVHVKNIHGSTQANVAMISGCRDDQVSMDAFEAGKNQGAMTYAFLETVKIQEALTSQPKGARVKKNFSYWNLMTYLLQFLKEKGYRQVPQLTTGKLIDLEEKWGI